MTDIQFILDMIQTLTQIGKRHWSLALIYGIDLF